MVDQGIDQLVLGCTHYPFLIPIIQKILPAGIRIIDPAPAVARQTRKVLEKQNGLNSSYRLSVVGYQFFSTGDTGKLSRVLAQLTGKEYVVNQLSGLPLTISGQPS
jgi:glutamate racemase